MKIVIDKMPKTSKECLFNEVKIITREEPKRKVFEFFFGPQIAFMAADGCCLDHNYCELATKGICNKLTTKNKEEKQ